MKPRMSHSPALCLRASGFWLVVCLSLLLPCPNITKAQTLTVLHTFTNSPDGATGAGGLTLAGNILYGTTEYGGDANLGFAGTSSGGTFYKINTDGTGYTNLYSFTGGNDSSSPVDALILVGNTFYGTSGGGGADDGTIFAINPDGTDYTNLQSLSGYTGGYNPQDALVASGNRLYGTALYGGTSYSYQCGTVFAINTDGTCYSNLYNFPIDPPNSSGFYTNSDGAQPVAGLTLSSNILYGATTIGGIYGGGTIFAINTDGTGFTNIYNFTATSQPNYSGTNYDGVEPCGTLVLSGNTLYGTAQYGGSMGLGTVFKVNADGTGFTTLHNFADGTDGAYPYAGMILSGNTLYGTTVQHSGVNQGYGSVFAINTDGTGYASLASFNIFGSDGGSLSAGVVLSGDTLYGTTTVLGDGYGTVFALTLQPTLAITTTGNQVVLSWPTWAPNFNLQSATNLVSPIWTAVSPAPVAINGQNVVTNTVCGTQMYYRLSQ
jgi:uncharacterized repeat protein (TIGR03803 family)